MLNPDLPTSRDTVPFEFDDLKLAVQSKASLQNLLSKSTRMKSTEAAAFVNTFFDLIAERLTQGEEVKLAHFGNFRVLHKSARPGRNPRTGNPAVVDPRRSVVFHVGPTLRKKLLTARPQAGLVERAIEDFSFLVEEWNEKLHTRARPQAQARLPR